uniref:Uncharacterized protein LOC104227939 n=1 Tax=Nicotiana sylvestris TaxID=4096 RepID=A0A1U7WF87_NICSY|nr:PREDICTED: uncharacterized protein LOC104227939 [Nicotiana sylvestris]
MAGKGEARLNAVADVSNNLMNSLNEASGEDSENTTPSATPEGEISPLPHGDLTILRERGASTSAAGEAPPAVKRLLEEWLTSALSNMLEKPTQGDVEDMPPTEIAAIADEPSATRIVTKTFQIKEQRLQRYQSEIHKLLPEFDECRLDQIPRAQNIEEDGLAKLAATTKNINKENVVTLLHSAIDHVEVHSINLTWDWRSRFAAYLKDGTPPQDKKEAKKLWVQAARYSLVNGDLYKRTFGGPLAKCLGPHQTRRVLEEVQEGHCSAHTGNNALV